MKKAAYGHKTPHQARVRSPIVRQAAGGRSNARLAGEVGVHVNTVHTWRGRFADGGLPALAVHDPDRTGHGHRALRRRQTRLPDRRQRLLPSREEGH
ncbi:helix-turn-helix domain-containing protein [Streptomyces sp. NPDC001739]